MKKVIILGAGDFQYPLILTAKDMGYQTHVFAWEDGAVGKQAADYFYPLSIVEKDRILEECKRIKPEAVVTIASDLGNITAQFLAEKLGLPCNSKECIELSTNKYKMRCAFKSHGLRTPGFAIVSLGEPLNSIRGLKFPVIVKPTDRSGSRGIMKVMHQDDMAFAVENAIENSFEKKAIIEEFIEGEEYSCESITFRGKHQLLAITKKYTTGAPHYIERGHLEPAPLPLNLQEDIESYIFSALDALGIENGASHAEFRIDPSGHIGIIEIGSRMGGDCIGSDLVKLSTGKDFVRMVIDVAAGKQPDMTPTSQPKAAVIRFIFSQKDNDVLTKIQRDAPGMIYRISQIEPVGCHEIVDSGTRCGFYILSCDTIEQAIELTEL